MTVSSALDLWGFQEGRILGPSRLRPSRGASSVMEHHSFGNCHGTPSSANDFDFFCARRARPAGSVIGHLHRERCHGTWACGPRPVLTAVGIGLVAFGVRAGP